MMRLLLLRDANAMQLVVRDEHIKTEYHSVRKGNEQSNRLDDKAAGPLSSTDLYRITTAALEGHVKGRLAYQALSNN
jgi:hypothetical protein